MKRKILACFLTLTIVATCSMPAYAATDMVTDPASDPSITEPVTPEEAVPIAKPIKVTGLTLKAVSRTSIKVTFRKVSDADKYYIYRKSGSNKEYKKVATVSTNSYLDKGLKTELKYSYKVAAANEGGTGEYSVIKTVSFIKPITVKNVKTKIMSKSSIKVSWYKVKNATGYEVYRKSGKTYKKIKTVKTTYFTNKGLKKGNTYTYKIRSIYKDGVSKYSKLQKIAFRKPFKVTNLKTKVVSKSKVKLTWNSVSNAASYEVYKKSPGSKKYKRIVTTKSTSFTSTKLKEGKKYTFKVRAINKLGKGTYSATKSATPKYVAPAPMFNKVKTVLENGKTYKSSYYKDKKYKMTLNWNKVKAAEEYRLERRKVGTKKWELVDYVSTNKYDLTYSYFSDAPNKYEYRVRATVYRGKYRKPANSVFSKVYRPQVKWTVASKEKKTVEYKSWEYREIANGTFEDLTDMTEDEMWDYIGQSMLTNGASTGGIVSDGWFGEYRWITRTKTITVTTYKLKLNI